jgi:hypothetical protein
MPPFVVMLTRTGVSRLHLSGGDASWLPKATSSALRARRRSRPG